MFVCCISCLSLTQHLFHSQNLQTSARRRPIATHPTRQGSNSTMTHCYSRRRQSPVSIWVLFGFICPCMCLYFQELMKKPICIL